MAACLRVFAYLYEAELPPVDSVGHRGQRGDGQQRQQTKRNDAHRQVQLHPPHLLVHPGILHALLHLEHTPISWAALKQVLQFQVLDIAGTGFISFKVYHVLWRCSFNSSNLIIKMLQ